MLPPIRKGKPRTHGIVGLSLKPARKGRHLSAATSTLEDPIAELTEFPAAAYGDQPTTGGTPPDTQIAVGPTRVVEMVNATAYVYNKAGGAPIDTFSLPAFFGTTTTFPAASDPKVLYDAESGRFFASMLLFDGCDPDPPPAGSGCTTSGNSRVEVAVSDTADPGGTWAVYEVKSNTSNVLYDQPKLGVASDKVVMSWNDSGGLYEFVVVQKSDVVAGAATAAATFFGPDSGRFNIIPVHSLTPTTTEYAIYHHLGESEVKVLAFTGTPAAGNVSFTQTNLGIASWSPSPAAEQPGGPTLENSPEGIQSAVWKGGTLWAAGSDSCMDPADTAARSCIRFIRVAAPISGTPTLVTDVDLTLVGGHLFYPAVTLDAGGNLWAGFSASSTTMYATATVAAVPGGIFPPVVGGLFYRSGSGPYNCTFCQGRNRWGDYSGAAVDPSNTNDIWVAEEYGTISTTDTDTWGTAIGRFTLAAPVVTSISPNTTPELSQACAPTVTVNGREFVAGGSTVRFGTVAASNVNVTSPERLTALAPPQAAGTVDVTVETANGTSATSAADRFTYLPDTIAPTSTAQVVPSPNALGFNNTNATVNFAATDNPCGSGVANITYSASGAQTIPSTTVPGSSTSTVISAEGLTTVTFFARDNAGNVEAAHTLIVKVDKTPPAISIASPLATNYFLNELVAASYSCTDGFSGVATCVGTAPNGTNVDTSTLGNHAFTVNATDNAGNASTQTVIYVVTYNICLLYDPTRPLIQSGATVPIRLQLCDANGVNLSSPTITVTPIELVTAGGIHVADITGSFRYDADLAGYIFNFRTTGLASGEYRLRFTVDGDLVTHEAPFTIR